MTERLSPGTDAPLLVNCPRCLGPLGKGAPSRRYRDRMEVLICRICRREQEINAHGHLAERPDGTEIIHPNREEWPIPFEEQFLTRSHRDDEAPTAVTGQPAQAVEVDDDMSDREYVQDDDEMPGEEHADMLKRLGLTQDEWEAGMR